VAVGLVVGVGEGPEKGFLGGDLQDDMTSAIRKQVTRALFFIAMTITQALRDVNVHEDGSTQMLLVNQGQSGPLR